LSTSWPAERLFRIFQPGQCGFFGVGMYTTAALTTKFGVPSATIPRGGDGGPAGRGIGAVVFRLRRLRGELFALLTLAVTFVIATVILNTPIDGGGGVFMSAVPLPHLMPTPTGTIYVLGFAMCVLTLGTAWWVAFAAGMGLSPSTRRGRGRGQGRADLPLQDRGLRAFAGIAGTVGGIRAMQCQLSRWPAPSADRAAYVVLMSVLGGSRHWLGPAIGATPSRRSSRFISGEAMVGRGIVIDPDPRHSVAAGRRNTGVQRWLK
jgi:branched-chain amino acid transport system permease protein